MTGAAAGDDGHIITLSSLYPSAEEPLAGLFIRERMMRVARSLPVTVVAPTAWFPFQSLLRHWRPGFRLTRSVDARDGELLVHRPRYFSLPGPIRFDGRGMALAVRPVVQRIARANGGPALLDAHFAYPDGYAGALVARALGLPYVVTLRGTESRHSELSLIRPLMERALRGADRVFSVSASLRELALRLGVEPSRAIVVPNGVDTVRFAPRPREQVRAGLGVPAGARVLVTVGGLVRRKGFHRVIALLPELRRRHGDVRYLVVGGASREGDERSRLESLARSAGVAPWVQFLGGLPPDALAGPLSAADLFVLASDNEGWANVLLESMACGTPVVASDVGGNREVVANDAVGSIVDHRDEAALLAALDDALGRSWDRAAILRYAAENSWDRRVGELVGHLRAVLRGIPAPGVR